MRPLAASVFLLVVVGCGDGGGSEPPDAAGTVDAGMTDGACSASPDGAPSGHALGDLNGTWAVLERVHAVVGQPLPSSQLSRQMYTFDITQTGTDLAIVEHMCDIQVDDLSGAETTRMLPALFASLAPTNRTGSLTGDATAGFELTTVQAYRVRGVALTDIATEALPTEATDPRLRDMDSDSKPGVTLLLDGLLDGRAYVVQREWNLYYDAALVTPDRIEGRSMWSSEQIYLGSDPPEIAELGIVATPDADPAKHEVVLVRVPDGSDCAFVAAHQCTLFDGK